LLIIIISFLLLKKNKRCKEKLCCTRPCKEDSQEPYCKV